MRWESKYWKPTKKISLLFSVHECSFSKSFLIDGIVHTNSQMQRFSFFFVVCIDFLGSSKLCLKTHEPVRWMDGFGPEKSPPRYLLSESMIDTPLLYYSSKVVR